MIVRSSHLGFSVPKHTGAWASVTYPGDQIQLAEARLTGNVPADTSGAPWPIAILVPGINVAPDGYRWLAVRLAEAGVAAVTYSTIGSLGPAGIGVTPGIDMEALAPDAIGTRCSAPAIPSLLAALAAVENAPITGHLDLGRVALIGHSAGGTVALHNSRADWIPGLTAVATYGAHTMTATALGHEEATVVSVPARVPVMIVGAASDAVVDQSRDRYTSADGEHDPLGRTFGEAIGRDDQDSWLVELADGNHFTICHPVDETSGRTFLERDLRADDVITRDLLARLLIAFLAEPLGLEGDHESLTTLVHDPGVHRWARR
ncbi:MAG: alpha/beta hydrolase [Acidimicrobiales bacterium]